MTNQVLQVPILPAVKGHLKVYIFSSTEMAFFFFFFFWS